MTKDLSTEQAETGLMQFWGNFDETGWTPPAEKADIGAWGNTTMSVFRIGKSCPYWMGDLLNFGESAYGEKYAAVLDEGIYQHGTAQNYAWVCAQWPKQTRHPLPMTFSHHQELTPLSPGWRKTWMERALQGDKGQHWSTSRLRAEIKEWKELGCPDPAFNEDGAPNVPQPPSNGKASPNDPVIVQGTVATDRGPSEDIPAVVLDPEPSYDYEPAMANYPMAGSDAPVSPPPDVDSKDLMGLSTDDFSVQWHPQQSEILLNDGGAVWIRVRAGAIMELISVLATIQENIKLERGA